MICCTCKNDLPPEAFYKSSKYRCIECTKMYRKKYYWDHKERENTLSKLWYEEHREEKIERTKAWNNANPEKYRGYLEKWRDRHPDIYERNLEILRTYTQLPEKTFLLDNFFADEKKGLNIKNT